MSAGRATVQLFPTAVDVAEAARDYVLAVAAAVGQDRPFHIVLAGGSTPALLYRMLAEETALDWSNVHIWFGDERTVPPDHEDSNFKMVHDTLLAEIDMPPDNIHRMRGETEPASAASDYAEEISRLVPTNAEGLPVFDVVILGLGEDGHTASLFPDTTALDEARKTVISNVVPQQNTVRITLTYPVLNAAAHVVFLVTGAAKAGPLAAVLSGAADAPPAARVQPEPGLLRWFVDEPAAAELASDQVSR